jgi:hypothetical protein
MARRDARGFVELLMNEEGMTEEEAMEFLNENEVV